MPTPSSESHRPNSIAELGRETVGSRPEHRLRDPVGWLAVNDECMKPPLPCRPTVM